MSGHSKWSKVKHQKEATDAVKGKAFTKCANAIIIAVKEGGTSDPESNFKLRLAIEKAREYNMPKDKIEKAIERASGAGEGGSMEQVVYEAFGPGGIGIIIEAVTDNKQRTVSALKNILERSGGVLATTGAVSHMFQYTGLINIPKQNKSFDTLLEQAISAGASDIEDLGESVDIYTTPSDLHKVKSIMEKQLPINSYELYYRPSVEIRIDDKNKAENILKLISNIEEYEDVHKVYANFDVPDEFLK